MKRQPGERDWALKLHGCTWSVLWTQQRFESQGSGIRIHNRIVVNHAKFLGVDELIGKFM